MFRGRTLAVAIAIAMGSVVAPQRAQAAEPSAAEIAVARKLFREATELEGKKQWAAAEGKLREALAIKETPGLRYHLAFCLEQQGKLVEALVDYDRADEMIQTGTKAPDVEQLLEKARDALRLRVPTLTVEVPKDVTGATLEIDGKAVSPALVGKPVPLNPGQHDVQIAAPGHKRFGTLVSLEESEKKTLPVKLTRDASASAPPPADAPSGDSGTADVTADSSGWSTRTWVLIGEGAFTALGLGVGIFYTLDKSNADQSVSDAQAEIDRLSGGDPSACNSPTKELESACTQLPKLQDQLDRAKTLQLVGFAAAGAGALATAATFVLWKPEEKTTALRVGTVPAPGGGFVSVSGRF